MDNTTRRVQQNREVETRTFPQFGKLPAEIQMMIWDYAHPRDVPDAILVFVNFDLNRPRAILSLPSPLTGVYVEIEEDEAICRDSRLHSPTAFKSHVRHEVTKPSPAYHSPTTRHDTR